MRWTKLNTEYDADPNVPNPTVTVDDDVVDLRFRLNPFIWKDVNIGDEALLTFHGALMYRLGRTNDEGFYRGQCRFSQSGIKWGDFYELLESDWENSFPEDKVVVSSPEPHAELKHYLFYFRDDTFECIAQRFDFKRLGGGNAEARGLGSIFRSWLSSLLRT